MCDREVLWKSYQQLGEGGGEMPEFSIGWSLLEGVGAVTSLYFFKTTSEGRRRGLAGGVEKLVTFTR